MSDEFVNELLTKLEILEREKAEHETLRSKLISESTIYQEKV